LQEREYYGEALCAKNAQSMHENGQLFLILKENGFCRSGGFTAMNAKKPQR